MWSSVRHQPGPQFNGALLTPRRAARALSLCLPPKALLGAHL